MEPFLLVDMAIFTTYLTRVVQACFTMRSYLPRPTKAEQTVGAPVMYELWGIVVNKCFKTCEFFVAGYFFGKSSISRAYMANFRPFRTPKNEAIRDLRDRPRRDIVESLARMIGRIFLADNLSEGACRHNTAGYSPHTLESTPADEEVGYFTQPTVRAVPHLSPPRIPNPERAATDIPRVPRIDRLGENKVRG